MNFKKQNQRRRVLQVLGAMAAAGIAGPIRAQSAHPSRPIKIVVPFSAGTGSDVLARSSGPKCPPP